MSSTSRIALLARALCYRRNGCLRSEPRTKKCVAEYLAHANISHRQSIRRDKNGTHRVFNNLLFNVALHGEDELEEQVEEDQNE
jgi:hypothetical protein